MSAESRWLRLNANWMKSEWLFVLSAESRLAWVQLLCYVKSEGTKGRAKALTPLVFARSNFVGEESVAQMLLAAKADGAIEEEDGCWVVTAWRSYQPDDSTERVRRFREKADVTAVTPGNALHRRVTETETETREGGMRAAAPSLPESLDTPAFREAWDEWARHRSEIRKPLKPTTASRQVAFLARQPDPIMCLQYSIMGGYTGLFEVKSRGSPKTLQSEADRILKEAGIGT